MRKLLAASRLVDSVLAAIAEAVGWLFVILVAVICFDVVTRKIGFQISGFGSTMLQELEWHIHTVMFAGWLGYCYIRNAHVRVDSLTAGLSTRGKAWLELMGCIGFALPYCLILVYFSVPFFQASWESGEVSDATTGLPYRWLIKGLLVVGFWLVLAAVLSMICRLVVFLSGSVDPDEVALPFN